MFQMRAWVRRDVAERLVERITGGRPSLGNGFSTLIGLAGEMVLSYGQCRFSDVEGAMDGIFERLREVLDE